MLGTQKSIVFWSAVGVPAGGTGIYGGYYLYDQYHPTANGILASEGYKWNIPNPKAGADALNPDKVFKNQEIRGCFQNFFPGVAFTKYTEDSITKEPTGDPSYLSYTETTTHSADPIGCALMDFSFQKVDEPNQSQWVFSSEITVKNDKLGWALWVEGRNAYSSDSSQKTTTTSLRYILVFLKNVSTNWEVMGGYVWGDSGFASDSGTLSKLHISIPSSNSDSPVNWFSEASSLTSGALLSKQYSGVWTTSDEDGNGKGIFEEIEVWSGDDSNKNCAAEILGISDSDFLTCVDSSMGYCSVVTSYKKEDNKWVHYSSDNAGIDISSVLNQFYEPFRNKKGKWTEFSEIEKRCNGLYYSRSSSEGDREYLRNFCYAKTEKFSSLS